MTGNNLGRGSAMQELLDRLAEATPDADQSAGADRLIAEHVARNPNRPGRDHARLAGTAFPVWAVVGYVAALSPEAPLAERIERAAADYEVSPDAIAAAVAYYRRHKGLIDARIRLAFEAANE